MENDQPKQSYWKQVVITIATVYPLILLSDWVLGLFLRMQSIPPKLGIFLSVVIVAALMVWPVMQMVHKYLGSWISKK